MSEERAKTGLYRANVGLALFNRDGHVFLGKRAGVASAYQWQMPQGGIDDGETEMDAAFRELEEEIGVRASNAVLLDQTQDWLSYDYPDDVRESTRGKHLGQRQKWFALRFTGEDGDIKLDTHTPEFVDWRWAHLAEAPALIVPFKRGVYEEVARRFARFAAGAS